MKFLKLELGDEEPHITDFYAIFWKQESLLFEISRTQGLLRDLVDQEKLFEAIKAESD